MVIIPISIIINDSKSTSFSSSINLIKSYRNIYWILGGQSKMGDKLTLKKSDFYDVKSLHIWER